MSVFLLHRSYTGYACDELAQALRCERVAAWSQEGTRMWHFWWGLALEHRAKAAGYYLHVAYYSLFIGCCGFDAPVGSLRSHLIAHQWERGRVLAGCAIPGTKRGH